jgi:cytochrome P450
MSERKLPGIYNPVQGALEMLRLRRNVLAELSKGRNNFGRFAYLRAGPFHIYQLSEPALLHEMFAQKHKIFTRPTRFKNMISVFDHGGILSAEGEAWKEQRRLVSPHFAPQAVEQLTGDIAGIAKTYVTEWAGQSEIDMRLQTGHFAFQVLADALLGMKNFDNGPASLCAAMTRLQDNMIGDLLSPLPLPALISTFVKGKWRDSRSEIIAALEQQIWEHKFDDKDGSGNGMLRTMIAAADISGENAGEKRRELADQIFQYFFAGHETFGNASAWALHIIARNPDIAAKIRAEADAVFGDGPITMESVGGLDYTTRAFKEVMRLYPSVYGNIRQAQQDTSLGEHAIKKGSYIGVPVWLLHRDPDWFPEPEKFDPDRFLPEREKALPRYAYQPFGAGPHACIGRNLAMLEGVILLAEACRRLDFAPLPGHEAMPKPMPYVTLTPEPGAKLAVSPRGTVPAPRQETQPAAEKPKSRCPFHRG